MLTEVPDPQPGPGQVLIKVDAAGMNPMDRTIADGGFKEMMPASFPLVLGADLAGIVEAVGDGAGRFLPGEEVFGQLLIAPLGSAGTYAERVAVGEDVPLARYRGASIRSSPQPYRPPARPHSPSLNCSSRSPGRPCCW